MPILGRKKDMEGITMSREGMTLEFIYYLLKENIKLKKENELLLDMFLLILVMILNLIRKVK